MREEYTPDSIEGSAALITQAVDGFLRGDSMAGLEGVERRADLKAALRHMAGFISMTARQMREYTQKQAQTSPAPAQAAPEGDCGCPDPKTADAAGKGA